MPCFWQEFLRALDPACGNSTLIFTSPIKAKHTDDFEPSVFAVTDSLDNPLFPTTATVTHVIAYDTAIGDPSGCTYLAWWNSGPPWLTDPPGTFGSRYVDTDVSVPFDPTIDPIPMGAIPGFSDSGGSILLSGSNMFVAILTIETDVGTCMVAVGADYCE